MSSNNSDVCRLCLSIDVKMFTIAATPLQIAYERISTYPLNTDERPLTVCYICHAELRRCHRLMRMSVKSETVLTAILQKYDEITKETVSSIGHQAKELNRKLTYSGPDGIDTTLPPATVEVKIEQDSEDELYVDMNNVEIQLTGELPNVLIHNTESNIKMETEDYVVCSDISIVEIKTEEVLDGSRLGNENEVAVHSPGSSESDIDIEHLTEQNRLKKVAAHSPGNAESDVDIEHLTEQEATLFKEIDFGHGLEIIKQVDVLSPGNADSDVDIEHITEQATLFKEINFGHDLERLKKDGASAKSKQKKRKGRENSKTPKKTRTVDYECKLCENRFQTLFHLRTHIRTHTGEKPYVCKICQRGFSDQSSLLKHEVIHTGEKQHECYICQHRFNRKYHLTRHLLTHTNNKPFECQICHRGFPDKTGLKWHLVSHNDEKQFECNACRRRFHYKHSLVKHYKTHTGEKPYECHICQRRFADKFNLRSHIKKMHDVKEY